MRRIEFDLLPRSWFLLLLLIFLISTLISVSVHAAPPIEEIRTLMAKRALRPQPKELLAVLDVNNLEASLRALDPYARYVPSSSSSSDTSLTAHFGIEIFAYKSRLWVRPDFGGPADQAGIPEIGELLAINNKKVHGEDLDWISALIDKAKRDDHLSLTVASRPGGKGKTYKVKPATVQSSSITWRRVGADIVIRINEFASHDTAPCLAAIFTTLVRPGVRVILDLRGCSGGDLYEAIEIAGMFVASGLPLANTYDRSGAVQAYRAPAGQKLISPVCVLIDRRTASSAEILAGILRYHHLVRVVGERSFGKCVSQTLIPLSDGSGLWLTTLGISFPDNTSCSEAGIKPDIPMPDVSVAKYSDILKRITDDIRVHR